MGNYFATSAYKDYVFMNQNNVISPTALNNCPVKLNTISPKSLTVQPKLSRFARIITTEVTATGNYYRDNSFLFKTIAWNKLNELQQLSKAFCGKRMDTDHYQENINKLNPSIEDNIKLTKKEPATTSTAYNRHLRGSVSGFDSGISNSVLSRVDSHFNCIYNPVKQLETTLNVCLNFTATLNMVDLLTTSPMNTKEVNTDYCATSSTNCPTDLNCCMGTVNEVCKATCFFVDINRPYEQQTLRKEHTFCSFRDGWPNSDSDGESLCSSKCDENENCDSFIIFDEDEFVENHFCSFQISWNATPHDSQTYMSTVSASSASWNTEIDEYGSKQCEHKYETGRNSTKNSSNKTCNRKVRFETDENLAVVHHMKHWDFAYREARKGPWELAAIDRSRFCHRIQDLESIIAPCLEKKLVTIQNIKNS